jgi:2-phospho-L-lactate transferase/gluconeogenesis factor (CofD/UPF0052 family)
MSEIILVNGGRGADAILPLLKKKNNILSVVNAYDDGKSTGEIRKNLNILGPSDLRKVHQLMIDDKSKNFKSINNLFNYRFPITDNSEIIKEIEKFIIFKNKNNIFSLAIQKKYLIFIKKYIKIFLTHLKKKKQFKFSDCSFMNCIYAASFLKNKKQLNAGIEEIRKIFSIKHSLMVNSSEVRHLVAIRENGKILYDEAEIVELRSNIRIKKIYLLERRLKKKSLDNFSFKNKIKFLENNHSDVEIDPLLKLKLTKAKLIIFCPGTQHSSLYPTYLTKGFTETLISNKRVKKILITNIGVDYETPKYKSSDFINNALRYLFSNKKLDNKILDFFDLILVNKPKNNKLSYYVKLDLKKLKKINNNIVIENFEDPKILGRHDFKKISKYFDKLLNEKY